MAATCGGPSPSDASGCRGADAAGSSAQPVAPKHNGLRYRSRVFPQVALTVSPVIVSFRYLVGLERLRSTRRPSDVFVGDVRPYSLNFAGRAPSRRASGVAEVEEPTQIRRRTVDLQGVKGVVEGGRRQRGPDSPNPSAHFTGVRQEGRHFDVHHIKRVSASSPPALGRLTGGAAPAHGATNVWDKVAQCESGGNWKINTGNGYYGGLQFPRAPGGRSAGASTPRRRTRRPRPSRSAIVVKGAAGQGQVHCDQAREVVRADPGRSPRRTTRSRAAGAVCGSLNKTTLKNPNRIYIGQVEQIP